MLGTVATVPSTIVTSFISHQPAAVPSRKYASAAELKVNVIDASSPQAPPETVARINVDVLADGGSRFRKYVLSVGSSADSLSAKSLHVPA